MAALNLDTKTRGRKTDEGLEIIGRLWREDTVDFEGIHYRCPAPDHAKTGAARSADVDRRLVRAAIRRTARFGTGWQAGAETPAEVAPVIAGIRSAAAAAGRTIDDDHYGAGFPFRFGRSDDPGLDRLFEAYRKRTGRDPLRYFAIGDAEAVVERIAAYVAAGISNSSCARPPAATRTCSRRPAADRGGTAARCGALAETRERHAAGFH